MSHLLPGSGGGGHCLVLQVIPAYRLPHEMWVSADGADPLAVLWEPRLAAVSSSRAIPLPALHLAATHAARPQSLHIVVAVQAKMARCWQQMRHRGHSVRAQRCH